MWGSERRLDDYLRGRLKRALDELAGIDADVILSENGDVVAAVLLGKHMPTEIQVDWEGATRTPVTEVTTQVRDQFDRGEVYTVPASKVVVSFPISGTTEMLDYQASTFTISGEYGKVTGGNVVVEVVERSLNADSIRRQVDRVKQDIDKRVAWANGDLAKFRATAEEAIRSNYARRKERILNDREVEEALGIPVRTSGTPRPPFLRGESRSPFRHGRHSQGSSLSRFWTRRSIRTCSTRFGPGQRLLNGLPGRRPSSTRKSFATCCSAT